jgi:hypothetical protein
MTRRSLIAASSLLVALVVGCGGREPCPVVEGAFACVEGATLARTTDPWCESELASTEGLEAEATKALRLAARVWGVDPADYLSGYVISFCGGWFVCRGGGESAWTYGCAEPDRALIKAGPNLHGCTAGVLVHELGHLVLHGGREHHDPRFAEATALADEACE